MGEILGRKRAFTIGCVIYGCGSLTTAISPNLAVLMFGWSFLEGRRRGARDAGDRGARRVELRPGRAADARTGSSRRAARSRSRSVR